MAQATPPGGPESFKPFIPASASLREFTLRAVVMGTLLGVVFGASSLYLVLKVGLTVSASIPVAVISLALFRAWSKMGLVLYPIIMWVCAIAAGTAAYLFLSEKGASFLISLPIGAITVGIVAKLSWLGLKNLRPVNCRNATILENNIVQTAGSAGESIAFGVGVTMPAILILGFDLEIARVTLVGLLGGLLGILMMIPLRRALIVAEHGKLKYPEGTACAEVLKAGADDESRAIAAASQPAKRGLASVVPSGTTIFAGFGLGLLYKTAMSAFRLWKDTPEKILGAPLKGGSVATEVSPELLGVGYIIGPRIASTMVAGGVLGYLMLVPMIKFFGEGLTTVIAPGTKLISEMSAGQIRGAYLLYIGAGAVAAGGIISLIRSLPTILHGVRSGLTDFRKAATNQISVLRTERELSMKFVAGGIVALIIAILLARPLHMNILGAILIVVFGFLFVTVSSRLTGEIGSSSNPISGMTVATLLLTCLIFLIVGWTGGTHYVTALSVGGIVCIAASNGGTTSQDLKTGYLVGGTPRLQQIAILIGAFVSALVLGPILLKLNAVTTVYVPAAQVAAGLHAPADAKLDRTETLPRSQFPEANNASFKVWHKTDEAGGPAGKYLVDDSGAAVWLVDPGINGAYTKRTDGTEVKKFEAPKAVLMSYIIKGILDRELPWALVLFGVMIAVTLELCGVSSLAFAVGVYIPISSSMPIFIGGLIRWWVDRRRRHDLREHKLSEEELVAEGDKSPGVLLASGYIAGGAIAGIIIAFIAGVLPELNTQIGNWAEKANPFYSGPNADVLSLLPFAVIAGLLYFVGRGVLMKGKAQP